jgi:hypothetical protein
MPERLPPAPPADASELRASPQPWGYWTVLLPCLVLFAWVLLMGLAGLVAQGTSGGVTPGDPGRAQLINAYETAQMVAFAAVLGLPVAALLRPRWRPAIALTAGGIFLADFVSLFLL